MEFLGIDFSGNARSWRAGRATSNVWVCRVRCGSDLRPHVTELQPVQRLAGNGPPFRRLADLLAGRQFSAAAIDAPFSLEVGDEKRLLRLQRQLAGYKLLIIDELGYVPLSQTGAELLFEVFSQRYEHGSTLVDLKPAV